MRTAGQLTDFLYGFQLIQRVIQIRQLKGLGKWQRCERTEQISQLLNAADAARAVSVQPLLAQGLKGEELGVALKRERLQALKTYKANAQKIAAKG